MCKKEISHGVEGFYKADIFMTFGTLNPGDIDAYNKHKDYLLNMGWKETILCPSRCDYND